MRYLRMLCRYKNQYDEDEIELLAEIVWKQKLPSGNEPRWETIQKYSEW